MASRVPTSQSHSSDNTSSNNGTNGSVIALSPLLSSTMIPSPSPSLSSMGVTLSHELERNRQLNAREVVFECAADQHLYMSHALLRPCLAHDAHTTRYITHPLLSTLSYGMTSI